jgi:hypothetical protein
VDRFHQTKFSGQVLFIAAGCALAALFSAPRAEATELAGATLDTENSVGAESCPTAEALRTRTLALGMPGATRGEPLSIHIAFRHVESSFFATVRTAGRTAGERELTAEGPTCEPLAAATAVMLAVLLDLRPRESPSAEAPKRDEQTPEPKRAPALFRYAALHAEFDSAYGVLGPTFGVAFGGDARLRLWHFELALGGFAFLDRTIDVPPGTVEVGLAGGDLALCAYFARFGRAEVAGCGSLRLGSFHGTGQGFYSNRSDASLWIAGGVGATLAIELTRHWVLRFGLDLLVPFRQYTPEIERVGVAYTPGPVGVLLDLGPELRFP